jgi:hypothetical protein
MISLKIKDSRGKESTTLGFVFFSWLILILKFSVSGIDLGALGVQQTISAGEFGMAVAAILAIWLGREWAEKKGTGNE